MIYLDYNATVPMKPAVLAAMVEAMERRGAPHSSHRFGRNARRLVEEARARVAAFLGARPSQILFTLGDPIVTTRALKLEPSPTSLWDRETLAAKLGAVHEPALFSFPYVDATTGVIYPVADLVAVAKAEGHFVLLDAAHAAGRLPLDFQALGVAAMALSAHRIGGPQGCGAVVVADGMRSLVGVEDQIDNVPALVAFGLAAQLAIDDLRLMPLMRRWRDNVESGLKAIAQNDLAILGADKKRVATTSCLALKGASGEAQARTLDLSGLAVDFSTRTLRVGGSSYKGSVTLSFGWNTKAEELRRFADQWRAFYLLTQPASSSRSFAA